MLITAMSSSHYRKYKVGDAYSPQVQGGVTIARTQRARVLVTPVLSLR